MRNSVLVAVFASAVAVSTAAFSVESQVDGMALLGTEKFAQAKQYFTDALGANPHDADAMASMAKLDVAMGKNEDAVDWAEKAVAAAPTSANEMVLGTACSRYVNDVSIFRKYGVAKKILAAYSKAAELDPKSTDAHYALAEYYMCAPGIAGGGEDKANQEVAQLQTLSPVKAELIRAQEAALNKDLAAAETHYKAALSQDASGESAYEYGLFLAQQSRFEDSIKMFAEGTAKDPSYSDNYYQIGHSAVMGKIEVQAGIQAMQKYLTLPHDWESPVSYKWGYYRLGNLYALAGDKQDARSEFEAALAIDPDLDPAKKALDDLK